MAPSQMNLAAYPTRIQPNYATYKAHLPLFMASARTDSPIPARSSKFFGFSQLPPEQHIPFPYPSLVCSWGFAVADEVLDQLRTQGFKDTQINGKPGMVHDAPNLQIVVGLKERNCIQTTYCNNNQMNIAGFRQAMVIQNIASGFLKMHQYPAFQDTAHIEEFDKFTIGKEEEVAISQFIMVILLTNHTSSKRVKRRRPRWTSMMARRAAIISSTNSK